MDIYELEQETLKPDLDQRAQLAERLLLSLDSSADGADMQVWIAESQRRLQEMRNGTAEDIPADQVVQQPGVQAHLHRIIAHRLRVAVA